MKGVSMKKLLFALLAIAVSPPLFAQVSGTITSSQLVCIGVSADHSTVGVQVTGTWTGTLQPQVAIQGQALTNSQVVPSTSTTAASTITANGVYYANVGSASQFCILGNTVASGSAVVFLNAAKGVNASTLGGGGAGGLPSGLTYVAPTLTISAAGAGNGAVALSGNTSGTATITAPSIAGTATNPVTISNILAGPNGAAATPTYGFTGCATCGMYQTGSFLALNSLNNLALQVGGNTAINVFGSAGTTGNTFTNGSGGGSDSGFFRIAAGVFTMGTATGGDETGLLRTANTCRITADVSLTVNTANSFCSFSLPAVAKAWAFRCDIQWAITAGSGTNTFALGVNASQTPTGTTNAEGQVYTATTGTQTMASAAIGASGAINVLTGATYSPVATVQAAKISGTLLASGTAGTFAITAAANGTTATAAVKAGSACWLN
jgi:hypothetical protein